MSVNVEYDYFSADISLKYITYFCYRKSVLYILFNEGPSCTWSYGSWIYNYLCNQYLSPLM